MQQILNFSAQNWESGFFWFLNEKNEVLLAKHWLRWLPVTQKLRRTVLKNLNTEWQEKKNQILLYVWIILSFTEPPLKRKEFALDNHDYRLIFFQDVAAIIYQTGFFFAFLSKTRANWSLTRKNEAVKPRPLLIATKKLTKKNFLCVPLCVWWALQ